MVIWIAATQLSAIQMVPLFKCPVIWICDWYQASKYQNISLFIQMVIWIGDCYSNGSVIQMSSIWIPTGPETCFQHLNIWQAQFGIGTEQCYRNNAMVLMLIWWDRFRICFMILYVSVVYLLLAFGIDYFGTFINESGAYCVNLTNLTKRNQT